jgi:ribosomal protein S12 methylthiotransferase
MGRPGDAGEFLKLVTGLRSAMPDVAIRSTFLVGFPGEDEAAFERLLEFLESAQLDRAGAFAYSREPGTPAADMPDQVPEDVAQERYHRLMTSQHAISLGRNRKWLGREIEVLIESHGEGRSQWIGRSFRDAPEIDGSVLVKTRRRLRPGQLVSTSVTEAHPYDLVARA